VRSHSAWALGRIGGDAATAALVRALERESDPAIRDEIERGLADRRGDEPGMR